MVDGTSFMLEILDTATAEEYFCLRDQWLKDGDAFLLVYSVLRKWSFDDHIPSLIENLQLCKDEYIVRKVPTFTD